MSKTHNFTQEKKHTISKITVKYSFSNGVSCKNVVAKSLMTAVRVHTDLECVIRSVLFTVSVEIMSENVLKHKYLGFLFLNHMRSAQDIS